jgi:hypothetical protein
VLVSIPHYYPSSRDILAINFTCESDFLQS